MGILSGEVMTQNLPQGNDNLIYGKNAVFELLRSDRPVDSVLCSLKKTDGAYHKLRVLCKERNVVLKEVAPDKLNRLIDGVHQGVAAFTGDFIYTDLTASIEEQRRQGRRLFYVLCDGLEDPHNLGAVIRTAECAGASGVIIGERRSVSVTGTVVKASAGATAYLPVIRVKNLNRALEQLKQAGVFVYGADMDGADFRKTDFSGDVCLVVGSEGKGLSRLVKEHCDTIVSLPMKGNVNSLNASVAAGILIYAMEGCGRE